MKRSEIFQTVGAITLVTGLALTPLTTPAFAQTNPSNTDSTARTDTSSRPGVDNRDRDGDGSKWGLLGLVGIVGLAGLAKDKDKRRDADPYRDPNVNR